MGVDNEAERTTTEANEVGCEMREDIANVQKATLNGRPGRVNGVVGRLT